VSTGITGSAASAGDDSRDFFTGDEQEELFDSEAAPHAYRPDPDEVRAELHRILAEARPAKTIPWEPRRVSLYRTIFPQMTNWLPDEEAAQLRFAFEEMVRLKAA
jgi:hypothetical protein